MVEGGDVWGSSLRSPIYAEPPLVDPDEVRLWLGEAWADTQLVPGDPLIEDAASMSSAYVREYCSRGIPVPTPAAVQAVALAMAVRLVTNPRSLKSSAVEGQSVGLPPLGLTFFESLLLARYRRRTA